MSKRLNLFILFMYTQRSFTSQVISKIYFLTFASYIEKLPETRTWKKHVKTWKKQINNVCKHCARNIGVLNKVKRFLPEQALYKLYCTLVLPYLNYGLLLWGNGNKTCLDKVHKLQKRAFRTISNGPYLAPTKGLFKRFKSDVR